jgi:hypothetical protein
LVLQQADTLVSEGKMDSDSHAFPLIALNFYLAAMFPDDPPYD